MTVSILKTTAAWYVKTPAGAAKSKLPAKAPSTTTTQMMHLGKLSKANIGASSPA